MNCFIRTTAIVMHLVVFLCCRHMMHVLCLVGSGSVRAQYI